MVEVVGCPLPLPLMLAVEVVGRRVLLVLAQLVYPERRRSLQVRVEAVTTEAVVRVARPLEPQTPLAGLAYLTLWAAVGDQGVADHRPAR